MSVELDNDPNAPIRVTTSYGLMVVVTSKDILIPGLSCGARGLALITQALYDPPTAQQIAELTGDPVVRIKRWMKELEGTGYLEVEE